MFTCQNAFYRRVATLEATKTPKVALRGRIRAPNYPQERLITYSRTLQPPLLFAKPKGVNINPATIPARGQ